MTPPIQCISEDVADELDYQSGMFTMDLRIRDKCLFKCCEKIKRTQDADIKAAKALAAAIEE